jgi:hypothetical protein
MTLYPAHTSAQSSGDDAHTEPAHWEIDTLLSQQ